MYEFSSRHPVTMSTPVKSFVKKKGRSTIHAIYIYICVYMQRRVDISIVHSIKRELNDAREGERAIEREDVAELLPDPNRVLNTANLESHDE